MLARRVSPRVIATYASDDPTENAACYRCYWLELAQS